MVTNINPLREIDAWFMTVPIHSPCNILNISWESLVTPSGDAFYEVIHYCDSNCIIQALGNE